MRVLTGFRPLWLRGSKLQFYLRKISTFLCLGKINQIIRCECDLHNDNIGLVCENKRSDHEKSDG